MKFFLAFLISMLVPIGFWIWGFDFNQRGDTASFCFFLTIYIFVLTNVILEKRK